MLPCQTMGYRGVKDVHVCSQESVFLGTHEVWSCKVNFKVSETNKKNATKMVLYTSIQFCHLARI